MNNSGYTPLQIACASQNKSDTEIVKLLLKYGGNPKLMNTDHFDHHVQNNNVCI